MAEQAEQAGRLWTTEDLARRWGVSPHWVRRLSRRDPRLTPIRLGHRTLRYDPDIVRAWERERRMPIQTGASK